MGVGPREPETFGIHTDFGLAGARAPVCPVDSLGARGLLPASSPPRQVFVHSSDGSLRQAGAGTGVIEAPPHPRQRAPVDAASGPACGPA